MRTLADVEADLVLAYQARNNIISGQRVNSAFFENTESGRKYIFEPVTLEKLNEWIYVLRAEEVQMNSIANGGGEMTFRNQATVPLSVTKHGTSKSWPYTN